MPVHLAIDARLMHLIEEAERLGQHRTKEEAVKAALDEYIQRRKQLQIVEMFGKVEFDEKYDYKRERKRKPKQK